MQGQGKLKFIEGRSPGWWGGLKVGIREERQQTDAVTAHYSAF